MSLNYYKSETEKVCKSKGWDKVNVDTGGFFLLKRLGNLLQQSDNIRKNSKR